MGDLNNIDIGWRSALMFAVCLPLVIVAGMLLVRRVERAANAFLAAFLLIAVIAQVPQIIGFAGFYTVWPGLTFAPFSVELYAGPLLYLHAYSLMFPAPLAWRRWLLLPGILQTAYYTGVFLALDDYRAKWEYSESFHVPYIEPVETAAGLALMFIAIFSIFRMITRYRKFLKDTQSAAMDFEPVWLTRLMAAIIIAAILITALKLAPVFMGPISYVSGFPLQVLLTAVVTWLGFQALVQTTVAFPKLETPATIDNEIDEKPAVAKDWSSEGAALRLAVREGGWYLESRLSIKDVASRMASNDTYVSRAVNLGLGATFNGFINSLRVSHAQALIREGQQPMIAIAAASGFNSKATFNRVFRELTGQTPSQYKKSQKP